MSLFVEQRGAGAPLVLLHGWGLNGAVWQPVVDQLSKHYCCYVVDLPGHGRSSLEDGAFTLEKIAQTVLEHVPPSAHWMGWSLGGLVAQYVAIHYADRIEKLILVATNAQYVVNDNWTAGMNPVVLAQFAEGLAKDYRQMLQRFLAIQAMGSPGARQLTKSMARQLDQYGFPDEAALRGGLSILKKTSFVEQLSEIDQACLLLFGRLDTLAPPTAGEDMAARMSNARCVVYTHAAHAPFLSHTEEFNREVEMFLAKAVA